MISNPTLDRSHASSFSRAFPKSFSRKLTDFQLIDTWRTHNIGAKEFTFYSHPHHSYARLDYILSTPVILANSSSASIHNCVWSDHYIHTAFTTEFFKLAPTSFTWRLNEAPHSDPVVEMEVTQSIDSYFASNDLPETPISTVWVAHKAVLRGVLISLAAARNASNRQRIL